MEVTQLRRVLVVRAVTCSSRPARAPAQLPTVQAATSTSALAQVLVLLVQVVASSCWQVLLVHQAPLLVHK